MAIAAGTFFEINSAAAASNINGGGFNPNNANFMTDGTVDTNTGNTSAPVFKSASYNFDNGDIGAKLYLKSGTNCFANTYYTIASVASNKATLSAAIGDAETFSGNMCLPSTVVGIASVGTPTGITFGIDYSRSTAAILSPGALSNIGTSSTTTFGGADAKISFVGNLLHLTGGGIGGTIGFYELVSFTNATTMVLDRGIGNNTVGASGNIGGALSLGSSDDAIFELARGSSTVSSKYFAKGNATYSIGGAVAVAAQGTAAHPCMLEGYNSRRGDRPTGSTRPVFACGANQFIMNGGSWNVRNISFTGTGTDVLVMNSANGRVIECKAVNSSTTAGRSAFNIAADANIFDCEAISYRGIGITIAVQAIGAFNNYVHDSNIGISAGTRIPVIGNIIAGCVTEGILSSDDENPIFGNTIYGAENKLGIGLLATTGAGEITVRNNIFYGLVTGISHPDGNTHNHSDYNTFFNNTNDVNSSSNWQKGPHDIALSPQFSNVAQLTGTTATTSGSVLTQSGGDFSSVIDGTHYLYLVSGTGVTAGIYGITAHTATTVTLDIAPGTNATADKVWQITTGLNFAVGKNMKAAGYPGAFPGGLTTGYTDIGAVQRQEPYAGSGNLHQIESGFIRG